MSERDMKGRFVPGTSGNPAGRSPRQVEKEYLDALIANVSMEDWEKIIERAVKDASNGDSVARKWLSDYLLPTPKQRTELSGPDGGPIDFKNLTNEQLERLRNGKPL